MSSIWVSQLVSSWARCSYYPVRALPFRAKSTMVRISCVLVHLSKHPISCSKLPYTHILVVVPRDSLLALGHFLREQICSSFFSLLKYSVRWVPTPISARITIITLLVARRPNLSSSLPAWFLEASLLLCWLLLLARLLGGVPRYMLCKF